MLLTCRRVWEQKSIWIFIYLIFLEELYSLFFLDAAWLPYSAALFPIWKVISASFHRLHLPPRSLFLSRRLSSDASHRNGMRGLVASQHSKWSCHGNVRLEGLFFWAGRLWTYRGYDGERMIFHNQTDAIPPHQFVGLFWGFLKACWVKSTAFRLFNSESCQDTDVITVRTWLHIFGSHLWMNGSFGSGFLLCRFLKNRNFKKKTRLCGGIWQHRSAPN